MSTSLSTLAEIQTEFVVRQNSATTVAYFTDAVIRNWMDQAHKYAAGYKKWPMTEGRISTSYASLATDDDGKLYGNYPEGWKLRSLRMLKVGGFLFAKKDFYAYNRFLEDFPSATDKVYTDHGNLYYLNSAASPTGTVTMWGQYVPILDTTDPTAQTIFSGTDEDGNQAIVELMQSFAMTREKKEDEAKNHLVKAQAILEGVWKKFTDESAMYTQPDNDGMFKRIDVVGGGFRADNLKRDQF